MLIHRAKSFSEYCDHCELNIEQPAGVSTILRRGELSVPFYLSQHDFVSIFRFIHRHPQVYITAGAFACTIIPKHTNYMPTTIRHI